MPSVGPSYPTAATSGSDPWSWISPTNIEGASLFASRSVGNGEGGTSSELTGTNFGFSISTGATINGIVVSFYRKVSNITNFIVRISSVYLQLNGALFGSQKTGGSSWTTSATQESRGSSVDTWSASPTPTDVNDSTFGFTILVDYDNAGESPRSMSVNAYQVTVYYTLATGVSGCQCSAIIGV